MCKRFIIEYRKSGTNINGEEVAGGRGEKKRIVNDLLSQGFIVTTCRDTPKAKPKTFRLKQ